MGRTDAAPRPTRVRFLVLAATALVAANMYLDRACLSQVGDVMRADLGLEEWHTDWVLGIFFWAYALCQVPAAALGVRFGFRRMLAVYFILWSAATACVGLAGGFVTVLIARLAVGAAEAGAYPTAAGLTRNWFPPAARGRAGSTVTLGGRVGWAASQFLTPVLLASLAGAAGLAGWRAVLVLYGMVGVAAAVVFWVVVRDAPRGHPWANRAEADYAGPPDPAQAAGPALPLAALVRERNLWLLGLNGFCTDFGWAFLITKLPEFLTERFAVPVEDRGWMASVPAWVSLFGMAAGGVLTDALVRRAGPRRARSLPIGTMMLVAAAAYLCCPWAGGPWAVVAVLGVVAVGVDVAGPAWWAFCQDVGGRHAGTVLGWGNMWMNVGAALSPVLLGLVKRSFGWDAVFLACAGAFVVAGLAGFLLDAGRKVEPSDSSRS